MSFFFAHHGVDTGARFGLRYRQVCDAMRHDVLCCAKYYRDTTRMFASSQASTFAALAFATGQYDPPQLDWLLGHERV